MSATAPVTARTLSVPYVAGTNYHFRMVVNLSAHTYSVFVTPQGGSEVALATNYAFRTEQATDSSLSDLAGFSTSGSATVLNFSILGAAPTITSFSPDTGVVGDGITDPAILTLTGTAVANSTVNVYDGTTLLGTATVNATGAWSFVTIPLPDGVHSFTATDTVAGKTSVASTALRVTIDTAAPAAPSIASFTTDSGTVGDHITNDSTLTLTGSAEANSHGQGLRRRNPAGQRRGQWQRGLELYDRGAGERRAQPDCHGKRRGRQHQCSLGGAERDHRYDSAGGAGHYLVHARHGYCW